ncbi:uncharacterized protein LOC110838176 isoform X3 [Zootermopsis nevadensis]|uniref:uncharacterized protein LOC110838176 isoform X3 n=1 Tax=Zootermopsis nevadensis TaxID=136037 RepID=UPI000B8E64D4|nr:uncharacterized protein LOC110838176 isoform X3 [Zootermopsis nevadensis]
MHDFLESVHPNGCDIAASKVCHMARDATTPSGRVMMSARSTPNLQHQQPGTGIAARGESKTSIYSYLHTQSGLNFAPVVQQQTQGDGGSPPPAPPVRDASSLKSIKYGPGHEKFPSWPVSAAADVPQSMRSAPGGGSHRSKSWTDHTNYPKEKGITYTRPYMKRPNPAFTQQQLKTVMERCEKIPPEAFESRPEMVEDNQGHQYLPRVDREGKALGDTDYLVPSPPERDIASKPQLTQADLEEYARSYQDPPQLTQVDLEAYARSYQDPKPQAVHLTQADLEEYSRVYEEALRPQHQQQPSYAQSEGYHSYVSSTDSITTTPFLDRLRRDSEATTRPVATAPTSWDEHPERERDGSHAGRDSVVTTSSGSASSSETLKWHGSLSDVSVASSSCTHHGSASSRQLIAHSARVQTPQRHHSESVLYLGGGNATQGNGWQAQVQRNNQHNKLRLFPVNTYTVQPDEQPSTHRLLPVSLPPPALSVAERISELERQQTRYTYLDPDKRHRVSDPTLKAIQKKALLSFYERHHSATTRNQAWRSEPQLAQPASAAPCPQSPPPQPPPPPRPHAARRASSASDYAGGAWREMAVNKENVNSESGSIRDGPRHQHSSSCGSLSADLLGPLIVGPSISVDDWVPERPPKKPHLRAAFAPPVPERLPSPDLPPPSPPPVLEDEVFASDEPLPPPPPELHSPDKISGSESHGERTSLLQKQLSQNISSVQRHQDATTHRHLKSSSGRSPGSGSPIHGESSAHRHTENIARSPQKSPGSKTQQCPENMPSPQSPSEAGAARISARHGEDPSQGDGSASAQQKYHKNRNSPDSNHVAHGQIENGMSSQRHPERGFSLPRHIEDRAVPQKRLDGINTSQRHLECGSATQRHTVNSNPVQGYRQNGSSQRRLENGASSQKRAENGDATAGLLDGVGPMAADVSVGRHVSSATLTRKQECGAVGSSLSHQGYIVTSPAYRNMNDAFARTSAIKPLESDTCTSAGVPLSRRADGGRSSARYPTQKLVVNGKLATPVSEQNKQRDGSVDVVRSADRSGLKNGEFLLPSKACLPSFSTAVRNGETDVPVEPLRTTRSPPHVKQHNGLPGRQQHTEDPGVLPSPPAACSEGIKGDWRHFAEAEQSVLEPSSPVTRLAVNSQPSTSKASYLAYRRDRDRGLPNFEGSYKLTMSPSGQEVATTTQTLPTECNRLPSAGNIATSMDKEHQQPTSHHIQAVCSEKFVLLTSVMDCNSNKDSSARTSDEVQLTEEETQCKVIQSPPPEEQRQVPASVTVNVETETQCDMPEAEPSPSLDPCLPPTAQQRISPRAMESLQLVQRSEVVLRVNAATSDAASQTESEREMVDVVVSPLIRQKLQEEIECERLSLDLVSHLPPTDKLQGLLVPVPELKKPTDYVSGLYRLDVTQRPRVTTSNAATSQTTTKLKSATTTNMTSNNDPAPSPDERANCEEAREPADSTVSPLSASSAYFTTSESKAKFLTRYGRDMKQSEHLNGLKDNKDLQQKKEELMSRLDRKLQVLRGEHLVVTEESRVNEELGESVADQVSRLARPHEASKYRLHVEEVGKITSLLLGLSGRLARAENALMGLPHHHTERKILESKRDKLKEQLEEAKKLKENIDRRSVCVSNILYKYFNAEEYADYDHFINMKAKLIMDSREIADKIKLGEEQLAALKETLSASD